MTDLQEAFWDNLLDYIQDRTVIPVIGSATRSAPTTNRSSTSCATCSVAQGFKRTWRLLR